MTDLFLKTKSKKEQLFDYIKEQRYLRTSEVIMWGVKNYCNRAERNARQLATEGRIRRISQDDKAFRFNTKEDIWSINSGR